MERERKKALNEIKLRSASLDINKIIEHARKHDNFVEKMRTEHKQKVMHLSFRSRSEDKQASHYRSKFYQRTLEQEQTRIEMEEAKAELRHLLMQKKKGYARYISQVYQPVHSEKKAQELLALKEKLHHPIRQAHKVSPGTHVSLHDRQSSLPFLSQNRSLMNDDSRSVAGMSVGQLANTLNRDNQSVNGIITHSPVQPRDKEKALRSNRSMSRQMGRPPLLPGGMASVNEKRHEIPKIRRISALPPKSKKFTDFLKADKQKAVIHPKKSLRSLHSAETRDGDRLMMKNKQNSRAVSAGDWQNYLGDKNLTTAERMRKI